VNVATCGDGCHGSDLWTPVRVSRLAISTRMLARLYGALMTRRRIHAKRVHTYVPR